MTELGRSELTRWVAERCLGWKVYGLDDSGYDENPAEHRLIQNVNGHWNHFAPGNRGTLFDPCTKIEHAMMLVDRMRELCYSFTLTAEDPPNSKVKVWLAGFGNRGFTAWHAGGDNPAEAITLACKAALESVK